MNLMIKNKKKLFKKILFVILFFSFIIQTFLIYTDNKGNNKMSKKELRGLNIWKKNNCQVCHQLYGFGGFLGSDLTNKIKIYNEIQLENLLQSNIKQMPIIKLSKKEINYLYNFLNFIDKTGISQLKLDKKNIKNIKWFEFNE